MRRLRTAIAGLAAVTLCGCGFHPLYGGLSGGTVPRTLASIYVEPVAQKTEAYQLINALVLDEGTICYAKPNLEIFADDVKASHGATIGQLSDSERFYLQTRGLSKKEAEELLLTGFCEEILAPIGASL